MKHIITKLFIIIGLVVVKLIISIFPSKLFVLIYQYVGNICAIATTKLGNHSTGTKAPHKNASPSATTLTIPTIAFLLLNIELIKNAKVNELNINKNILKI